MNETVQAYRTLYRNLFLFTLLAIFWFFYVAFPITGFISSDDAIPYQQAVEPWRAQDLFYWGTTRFGMLYEVSFKAINTLLGLPRLGIGSKFVTQAFYGVHFLLAFWGIAFWLGTLKKTSSRWIFFLFYLPVTQWEVWYFLLPGQLYGFLFFLNGVFFWSLAHLQKETVKNSLFFGFLIATIWTQHELAGLIAFGVFLSACSSFIFKRKNKAAWGFWSILITAVATVFFFKNQSRIWTFGNHYALNSPSVFMHLLWHTLRNASWGLEIRRFSGYFLTFSIFTLLFELWQRRKNLIQILTDYRTMTFLGCVCAILVVHLSEWYLHNNESPRYFLNLLPLLIWILLSRVEEMPPGLEGKKLLFLAAVIAPLYTMHAPHWWSNPIVRNELKISLPPNKDLFRYENATECEPEIMDHAADALQEKNNIVWKFFSLNWQNEACTLGRDFIAQKRAEALLQTGCKSYVDTYWGSHVLAVASNGLLITSAYNFTRNPVLLEKALAADPFCYTPRAPQEMIKLEKTLRCRPTEYGFFICRHS